MKLNKDDIFTAEDVCDILKIHVGTLRSRRWRSKVKIPVYRQGRYLFSLKRDFWKWYEGRIQY